MAMKTYTPLVQRYFPLSEWVRAECIIEQECPSSQASWPYSCIQAKGWMTCGPNPTPRQASAYGMFGILDVCYDPALNPDSPFTAEQWQRVLDPNMNAWMASIIWSNAGWRAWTTCEACTACDVLGEPVPYPRGPIEEASSEVPWWLLGAGVAAAALYAWASRRRGR